MGKHLDKIDYEDCKKIMEYCNKKQGGDYERK